MTVSEIRSLFFSFFEEKGHKIVSSAPMVIKDDPTLMFTNAGMNQFKDFILGNARPNYLRVANSQKCLRVSGKHNDLEEVGVDTYHHTMFEMLGNWSFGDYFKEEAIAWTWELLTERYKISHDRLYVTVFKGDETDGVSIDSESIEIWKKYIDSDRIILASKKDNFWEMGEIGPCGPCTEIHIDLRSDDLRTKIDGKTLVNTDHPQVIEIWNNVFMEFNRLSNGKLIPLAQKHVDTGMGLERLAMALQAKTSNYDIDLFQTIIKKIEEISNISYKDDPTTDIAIRVVADHIRAIAFAIADQQLPSNTGAGYVIRRILRRAVRYGYQNLQIKEPFLCEIVPTLVDCMGEAFPELKKQQTLIEKVVREEEISFFRTLAIGIKRIDALIEELKAKKIYAINGTDAFELYDTYGFPLDLTALIARENNLLIDVNGFQEQLKQQKERSRTDGTLQTSDWIIIKEDNVEEFIGYDQLKTKVYIVKYRQVTQKRKKFYQLVFNLTPFYPEGGGQVGDSGWIQSLDEKVIIFDTKKENNLIIHLSETLPNNVHALFEATVDITKRSLTTNNHSATHLLHKALRNVLGTHVEQRGSLVAPTYLRFDFSHFEKVTTQQLEEIEKLVTEDIRKNITLEEFRNMPIEEAKNMGATALFGEKYGDTVRVIKYDNSIELCGGTHVESTGQIGLFKITSETAIAAGIRRIEAITSKTAEMFYKKQTDTLQEIARQLKNPKDILKSVTDLQEKNRMLQKQIDTLQHEKAISIKQELKRNAQQYKRCTFIGEIINLDPKQVKDILFQLQHELPQLVAVIGSTQKQKCTLSVSISQELVDKYEWNANTFIKDVAPLIDGGGGGQNIFATAGGKNSKGLKQAIDYLKSVVL